MEEKLLEIFNQYGIINYTFLILFTGMLINIIHDLMSNLSAFLFEKTMYYYNKRKELKNNGS